MQFPLLMASKGVEAVVEFTPRVERSRAVTKFFNTGSSLQITDKPVAGIESTSTADGLKLCWG